MCACRLCLPVGSGNVHGNSDSYFIGLGSNTSLQTGCTCLHKDEFGWFVISFFRSFFRSFFLSFFRFFFSFLSFVFSFSFFLSFFLFLSFFRSLFFRSISFGRLFAGCLVWIVPDRVLQMTECCRWQSPLARYFTSRHEGSVVITAVGNSHKSNSQLTCWCTCKVSLQGSLHKICYLAGHTLPIKPYRSRVELISTPLSAVPYAI